jgi:hypothetical protein
VRLSFYQNQKQNTDAKAFNLTLSYIDDVLVYQIIIFSGAGTAHPSEAPVFTFGFSGVGVTRFLVLCVCFVDRCLSFCTFPFGQSLSFIFLC